MYIKTECRVKDKKYITKHYHGNYGAPGQKREPKRKRTPEEMAKQNLWQKVRYLTWLIELNFNPGDWHVTLTCKKELRPGKEEAPRVIRKFRDKLRKAYKKQGWELKYIITCETGERGAVHWHMIVNECRNERTSTATLIRQLWCRGRPYFSPLDDTGDYGQLAAYIVKETKDRIENEETIETLSYMPSRNLLRPVVRKKPVDADKWVKKPKAPEGWVVIEESVVNGKNKFTGLPYQYYTIRKLKKGAG